MRFFVFCTLFVITFAVPAKDKLTQHGLAKPLKADCSLTANKLGCACPVCEFTVKMVKEMVIDHEPSEEGVLDKVCRRVFSYDKRREALCEEIVKQELPEIIKYAKSINPIQACKKFC
ncbi:unnamed protein product [Caenorhabditis auriculariae]|uniref:Saposin B-type domain-containing protein n=1 Tax=Caenorhabditis auriculariae TaxID=2777116 RepID=A0A8S1GUQ1_9PELO|nr:unnamed protein product [Caenorhabditis auriculariae]